MEDGTSGRADLMGGIDTAVVVKSGRLNGATSGTVGVKAQTVAAERLSSLEEGSKPFNLSVTSRDLKVQVPSNASNNALNFIS